MLKSVSVTYTAPPGDSKVTEAFGHTFYDGKQETVEVSEEALRKLQGNRLFKCGEAKDVTEKTADPAKEKAAAEADAAADKAKREQQMADRPVVQRGAELKHPDEETDAQADPNQTPKHKGAAPREEAHGGDPKSGAQAGRDR